MKTKTFDCVDMKRKAQRTLMAEYEARKDEFASFADFINNPVSNEPEWLNAFRAKTHNP